MRCRNCAAALKRYAESRDSKPDEPFPWRMCPLFYLHPCKVEGKPRFPLTPSDCDADEQIYDTLQAWLPTEPIFESHANECA